MNSDRWLQARLAPPPDGPQARARGEVQAIDSDGGITIEVTVRQLALPQDAQVTLVCGGRDLVTFGIGAGSGSYAHTLDPGDAGCVKDGAEVTLHHVGGETVASGGVIAVEDPSTPLLHGVLREDDEEQP